MLDRHGERSQVVKAVDCDSTIRGFDPRRSPFFSAVIQKFVPKPCLKNWLGGHKIYDAASYTNRPLL
jgi:hypothetical protein